ncbi:MAG: fructose-bisphosphatase class III [Firmicutes bacterium]|nr:fructose-bisphosphatase class III [Bacillota bacterium]
MMATYVMSDLHGCYREFFAMLKKIGFSAEDQLYIIGDVVDRGRKNIPLLQYIMKEPNITLLLGNHELMMREALESGDNDLWFYNGGIFTLKEYQKLPKAEQAEIFDYLYSLPLFVDLTVAGRNYRLIHGAPLEDETDIEGNVWERPEPSDVFFDDRTAIIGHTPTRCYTDKDRIFYADNFIDIDCACVYYGHLACLRLEDRKEFYV